MSNRTSMFRKRCALCSNIRHRDEMMLMHRTSPEPLRRTQHVEDGIAVWVCFFCVEDMRKAEAMTLERFKAWQARRAA